MERKTGDESRRRSTDNGSMFKQIIVGIVVVLVAGWITYVSVKGTTLDAMIAGVKIEVAVLKEVTSTIKDDINEMKVIVKEIRDGQRRSR